MQARTVFSGSSKPRQAEWSVLLLAGSLTVSTVGYWAGVPDAWRAPVRLLLPALWLLLAWAAGRSARLAAWRPVCLAFFAVSLGIMAAWLAGPWPLRWLGLTTDSLRGMVVAKLTEAAAIVAAILGVSRLEGALLTDLALRRGRLGRSLVRGAGVAALLWLFFMAMGGWQAIVYLGASRLLAALPPVMVFAAANGFMEELWFRGLYLARFEALAGARGSLILTALAFAALHVATSYGSEELLPLLAITLLLGLACGWIVQSTRTLWGAVLAHAAGDVLILLGFFWHLF